MSTPRILVVLLLLGGWPSNSVNGQTPHYGLQYQAATAGSPSSHDHTRYHSPHAREFASPVRGDSMPRWGTPSHHELGGAPRQPVHPVHNEHFAVAGHAGPGAVGPVIGHEREVPAPAWGPPPMSAYERALHERLTRGPIQQASACSTCGEAVACGCPTEPWTWQFLPQGVLFRNYLAGPKESRLGVSWNYRNDDEWVMDGTLGGHVGLVRYGTVGGKNAEGYQLDFDGAALLRMNWTQDLDMDGTDYRFGIPLTYAKGPWEWRLGYYHISSHTGDEYLVRNNTLVRENYVRDSIVFGLAYFVTEDLRVYGEVDAAFHERAGADAFHFQFGFDYSPVQCGISPFVAANGLLREEVNYGGGFNFMIGWQYLPVDYDYLLRIGFRYYNGESTQYSFFDEHEELIGFGLWYDY